ncbi:hypothetical protein SZN_24528 [Streptomyces zinciresistens K42]|uniref:Secreted protein n=1 Tax=Streptomyces zinciresistens K42 TaxID=700597 RepID=G2GHC1_9ACTN|nr:hypothetical protein [Streptomyces zinciresistens]EGX57075.1 hypothetical protein SZN_24528 [Streptomyces zinciresistens K42]
MSRKFAVITALALSTVVGSAGIATAGGSYGSDGATGSSTTVKGGSGFSSSPVVVNAPQQGVVIANGTLVDLRCAVPWSNGAVLGAVLAPNSKYVGCNTGKVEQGRKAVYGGGLLF